MIETIKFVIYSTLILAFGFGIAWPLVKFAQKKVEELKNESVHLKLLWSGVLIFIAVLGLVVAALDIFVNYTAATIVFQQLPDKGDYYLTQRIQRYLNELSQKDHPELYFNWYKRLYIKFVVMIANKIDRTPHFRIPANVKL